MIYLDHNATMPASKEHLARVVEILGQAGGNPSTSHRAGRAAKKALEDARTQVAEMLGCVRSQIFFVSGATEGNNAVVFSVAEAARGSDAGLVITSGEHVCHLKSCEYYGARNSLGVRVVPLAPSGVVDEPRLFESLHRTAYFGINHTNHETGMIHEVGRLAEEAKKSSGGCHVHVDAAQAFGKQDLSYVAESAIDSLTFSAHKIGGLQGIGGIYVKNPEMLRPLMKGGGQERGRRPGTENLSGAISLGLRAQEVQARPDWLDGARKVYDELMVEIGRRPEIKVFGHQQYSSRLAASFCITGGFADELDGIWQRNDVVMGRGAACSFSDPEGSVVLKSMGASDFEAKNAFRISLGPDNTSEQIQHWLNILDHEVLPRCGRC